VCSKNATIGGMKGGPGPTPSREEKKKEQREWPTSGAKEKEVEMAPRGKETKKKKAPGPLTRRPFEDQKRREGEFGEGWRGKKRRSRPRHLKEGWGGPESRRRKGLAEVQEKKSMVFLGPGEKKKGGHTGMWPGRKKRKKKLFF